MTALGHEHARLDARQATVRQAVVAATAAQDGARTALADGARDSALPAVRAELAEVR